MNLDKLNNNAYMSIKILSPERILLRSYGEINSPETINYRTYRPEKGGLFCAKIFGPIEDYSCLCGKYKRIKYKGIKCERCGVEVTHSSVRRERMGHINLPVPIVNCLFFSSVPGKIPIIFNLQMKELMHVLYYNKYLVLNPGISTFKEFQIISREDYENTVVEIGEFGFNAKMGGDAFYQGLKIIDDRIEIEIKNAKESLENISENSLKASLIRRRLELLENFFHSGNKLQWMVFTVLPVLPPDLRPMVHLGSSQLITSDLNRFYSQIVVCVLRLTQLQKTFAPAIILENEKRMLQDAVDALLNNSGSNVRSIKNTFGMPLKSLTDALKGKKGRFRQNLLGKRVDYSGRSVIVVGPHLKLHECGLPKIMALELFKPFIVSRLISTGKTHSIKIALQIIDKKEEAVWDALDYVIKDKLVLLNRAPTLHRLGIQAFYPILIESKAIQLHPLVCTAFNADFDGDQMAVHLPLSVEAQLEARVLMLSSKNLISPASGSCVVVPRKDITAGLFYGTFPLLDANNSGKIFFQKNDVIVALDQKNIKINSKIKFLQSFIDSDEKKLIEVSAGNVLLINILPQVKDFNFELLLKSWSISNLSIIVDEVYSFFGVDQTAIFVDEIMKFGFEWITMSSISIGKDDFIIPNNKYDLVQDAENQISIIDEKYESGIITLREKINIQSDIWSKVTNDISSEMMKLTRKNENLESFNSLTVMLNSGARANEAQLRQLSGMRGLMYKSIDGLSADVIKSNFKEGLKTNEYFSSASGARKGISDTALKTADAGYLTRRLVDVSQDVIVSEDDCGTKDGIEYFHLYQGDKISTSVVTFIKGRILAKDLLLSNGEKIESGTLLIKDVLSKIENDVSISSVFVRSPVTCKLDDGICRKCYGYSYAENDLVQLGDAIGVIAAQSIGEPGTQLTMRTFYVGGAADKFLLSSVQKADFDGVVKFQDLNYVINSKNEKICISHDGAIILQSDNKTSFYKIQYASKIFVSDSQNIIFGEKISEWDQYNINIIAEHDGKVMFGDLHLDVSYADIYDDVTNISSKVVIYSEDSSLSPYLFIVDNNEMIYKDKSNNLDIKYYLGLHSVISINDGDFVKAGDIIAKVPKESFNIVQDITGGLPKVTEIFEARVPKSCAIVAEKDGYISFSAKKSKNRITLYPLDGSEEILYSVSKSRSVTFRNGAYVKAGSILVSGDTNPHDILRIHGVEALARHIVSKIYSIYIEQGVRIDSRHTEVIVKSMLRKVKVLNRGDSELKVGAVYELKNVLKENKNLSSQNKALISFEYLLYGVTKSSVSSDSFICAASFQETIKNLVDAAIKGKVDPLSGIKENVIIGGIIPAGTGFFKRKI